MNKYSILHFFVLLFLLLLFSVAASAQSHEFMLADKSNVTPGGIFITITPPSNWHKSSGSNSISWKRNEELFTSMKGEVLEYTNPQNTNVLKKTSDTRESGEEFFVDDETGAKTGVMKWQSKSNSINVNTMDIIVEMYGVSNTFHLSVYFIYNQSTGSMIEQEVKSVIKSIKTRGKYIPEPYIYPFSPNENRDTLFGFKNQDHKVVIPLQYYFADIFVDGLARVAIKKPSLFSAAGWEVRYGYIDKTGKMVIPAEFEEAGRFSEGLAGVMINSKWGFIDQTGKIVITPEYDDVDIFSEGLARVNKGMNRNNLKWDDVATRGKFGYIDKTGKVVLPLQYIFANNFLYGRALVELEKDRSFYIDKNGNKVD